MTWFTFLGGILCGACLAIIVIALRGDSSETYQYDPSTQQWERVR